MAIIPNGRHGLSIDLYSIEKQHFVLHHGCVLKFANEAAIRTNWFKKFSR